MKGCAKFLNVLAGIAFWFLILFTVALAAVTGVYAFMPERIPELPEEIGQIITINGSPLTTEMLLGYRNIILIFLGCCIVLFILTLILIGMVRRALKEVINEAPFSVKCSKSLKAAGILEIVSGIFSIAMGAAVQFMLGGVTFGETGSLNFSVNLTFIPVAVLFLMLSGISEFGRNQRTGSEY